VGELSGIKERGKHLLGKVGLRNQIKFCRENNLWVRVMNYDKNLCIES
jgi:hypothetical protein